MDLSENSNFSLSFENKNESEVIHGNWIYNYNEKTKYSDEDIQAYYILKPFESLELPEKYVHALSEYNYNEIVFLTPPWEEIFINDNERKENFEQACDIHQFITETYSNLGYKTIEIPKLKIKERVDFILEKIGEKV
jgi:predicted ATPase